MSIRDAYIARDEAIISFLGGAPARLWNAPPVTTEIDQRLATEIADYNDDAGGNRPDLTGPLAVVSTGHQPTLFTGPLYTVYKAITAIQAAKRVEEKHGVRCIPLFWIAGDDHDLEEAGTVHVLTKKNEVHAFRYAPENAKGRPLDNVHLDASLEAQAKELAAIVPGSEHRDDVLEALLDSLRNAESMTEWMARLLARLFQDTPLVLFAPSIPRARELAADIMRQEIEQPLESAKRVNAGGAALEALGFTAQVVKGETDCNFFLDVDGFRRKVTYQDNTFTAADSDFHYTQDELLAELKANPARFSPNVILRCIVQQHLFPTAAYVAGPGEIAYWAQLKTVFEQFSAPMPVVYPRSSAVLTTIKLNKLLKKYGLTPTQLDQDPERLVEHALAAESKNPVMDALAQTRETVDQALGSLGATTAKLAPNATDAAARLVERTNSEFDRMERALLRADDQKVVTVRQQIERLCNALAPSRKPQERMYTVFGYLFDQGWDFIPRLLQELDVDEFGLQEIEL
jgi:bacillithiol biosynthesis cysteine-adding enzyme BshC